MYIIWLFLFSISVFYVSVSVGLSRATRSGVAVSGLAF